MSGPFAGVASPAPRGANDDDGSSSASSRSSSSSHASEAFGSFGKAGGAPVVDYTPLVCDVERLFLTPLLARGAPADTEAFLARYSSYSVQQVVAQHAADVDEVFKAYARFAGGRWAMDVAQFVRLLKDATILSATFPAAAAQELFARLHKIFSEETVAGTDWEKGSAVDLLVEPDPDMAVSIFAGGPPVAMSPKADAAGQRVTLHLRGLLLGLVVLAQYDAPSPFVTLAAKAARFIGQTFLEAVQPKVAQLNKAARQQGAQPALSKFM
jgi:hypothetical protein